MEYLSTKDVVIIAFVLLSIVISFLNTVFYYKLKDNGKKNCDELCQKMEKIHSKLENVDRNVVFMTSDRDKNG